MAAVKSASSSSPTATVSHKFASGEKEEIGPQLEMEERIERFSPL